MPRKYRPTSFDWGTTVQALIGNGRMTATLLHNGNINHLFWPTVGFPQHIREAFAGILCGAEADHDFSWLNEKPWVHQQEYIPKTNILTTAYANDELQISVVGRDFVYPTADVLVRLFTLRNDSTEDLSIKFFHYQDPMVGEFDYGNVAVYDAAHDSIVHYHRQYYLVVGADRHSNSHQCGIRQTEDDALVDARDGELLGIDLSIFRGQLGVNSALCYDLGKLGPSQDELIRIFIGMGSTHQRAISLLEWTRATVASELCRRTRKYWEAYAPKIEGAKSFDRYKQLFHRSILILKLLSDKTHGGIIAAPCVNPDYRYVWPRDSTYMALALDSVGYHREAEAFYDWCRKAQDAEGALHQRYYVDPKIIGPCWGQELDEVGIVIWGCGKHYEITREKGFLDRNWSLVRNAAEYICVFQNEKTGDLEATFDLWEEDEAKHIYSFSAVAAGLKMASDLANQRGEKEFAEKWAGRTRILEDFISKHFWNEEKKRFMRKIEPYDDEVDVTALSLAIPFEVFSVEDPRIISTAEQLTSAFEFRAGGIGRYPSDRNYGGNPWIISTCWLAMYYARRGNVNQSKKLLDWCLDHATGLGLLPEQVHRDTGEPLSAVPLGWSHAMFIIATLEIAKLASYSQ